MRINSYGSHLQYVHAVKHIYKHFTSFLFHQSERSSGFHRTNRRFDIFCRKNSYENHHYGILYAQRLTRFRRTSDGDVIPGPEQGFGIVGGYFSADLKSFLSHSLNMHFPITRSSMAFLKIKVMLLS
jgi:hypothetical protein